jgi:hypothetical protein
MTSFIPNNMVIFDPMGDKDVCRHLAAEWEKLYLKNRAKTVSAERRTHGMCLEQQILTPHPVPWPDVFIIYLNLGRGIT